MKLDRHHFVFPVALIALFLSSCGQSEKSRPTRAEGAPRTVKVARVELRPMERGVQVVGILSAHDDATVAAQVAGEIEIHRVDLGDRVRAGEELALIDTAAYEARVLQSTANLTKATASAANAAQNLKRIQDLRQAKIASTSDLDQAVAEAAKTAADVKAAEAADAIARLDLERSRVKAPFDGAVAERIASVGDYVAVGAPIVRIVKTDPLRLRLEVPERESPSVKVGQIVRVTVEGDTNVYTGQLARVSPAIRNADRMLLVEADIPNHGELRAGLFARAQIIVNGREEGLSVPPDALSTFAGIAKVVVVKDGAAMEKTVMTGRRGKDWVEIISGLGTDEAVVLNPVGLRTGQPVSIEDAAGKAPATKSQAKGAR